MVLLLFRFTSHYIVFNVQWGLAYVSQLRAPNGDKEIRTLDPLLAGQVLSQLSYTPISVHGL